MDKPDIVEKGHNEGDHTPVRDDSSHERGAKVHHEDALQDTSDPDAGKSDEEREEIDKKLLRKLDMKLIPWLTLLYLISFLDRTNIGNAKIDGLIPDLQMTQGQYQACLSIFFVSYSLFEPLTNILLKKFRPSVFLTGSMILWGICMTCMGLVHNFSGLAAARFFLGMFEAGLFPGVNYYLSCWYKRSEFGIRAAIFFSAAALAGSFGGLLAAGIIQMRGVGGKPGWAWIFILEGLATILVGIASYWMVHDFPDEAKFLSDDDRKRVIRRLQADNQGSAKHEDFKMKYFWQSLKDWKTYAYCVVYMGCDMPLYAFSLFLPTIIREGGFAILLGSSNPSVQYAGVFLAATGIYPCIPNTIAWASNNLEGSYKRGVTIGIFVGWGNLNGIVSSNLYPDKNSQRYLSGHGVVLGYLAVCLLGGNIATNFLLEAENKKRRSGKKDHLIEGKSEEEIEDMGDKVPSFIYTT
ncbi:hypothetical protein CBER1_07009 [Cercospora berteroae]|uniref:Major facilitator superfamily (MFS) profile domain-containing protein n=1 Tax=Cercospora berteroae TaxID=357750 RepID=A0A2S6CBT5_9PEZI|nr:hypothetical protein CBER1_07009 [Cercospora berteroae]